MQFATVSGHLLTSHENSSVGRGVEKLFSALRLGLKKGCIVRIGINLTAENLAGYDFYSISFFQFFDGSRMLGVRW